MKNSWISLYSCAVNNKTIIEKCNFSGNREEIRIWATNHALKMLKVELENQNYK